MKKLNIAHLGTLSRVLGFPESYLLDISKNCETLYTTGNIPKKNSDSRTISKPRYKLKIIQSKIKKILSTIKLPDSVHGWVKKRSVKTATEIHRGMRYLYAFDILSYFDSISNNHINRLFINQLNCSPSVAHLLTRLSTYKYHLPQGSPCSPVLANLILNNFDLSMERYAKKGNAQYSRMGDDILLSANHRLIGIDFITNKMLKKSGLKKNIKKTVIEKQSMIVLGVNIGTKITIPRQYRRQVEAILHNAKKTGLNAQNIVGKYDFRKHLLGRIALIEMYHPEYGTRLREKLKNIPN